MCLKDEVQKLRNQIKRDGIKNALQHETILNLTINMDVKNDVHRRRKP